MTEDQVLDVVIRVLESIERKTEASGRHELNRTDLKKTIDELKIVGLTKMGQTMEEQLQSLKRLAATPKAA